MKTITTLAVTVLLGSHVMTTNATAQVSAQAESRVEVRGQTRAAPERTPTSGAASEQSRQGVGSLDAEAVVRATAEAGLPTAPVRRTVAEGEAKGAVEADVVRAAVRTQGRLMIAREALESDGEREPSQGEITLGAEALLRGADRADLERMADAAPEGRSLEASLQTMLSLGAQGQSARQISSSIAAQLAAGANDLSISALAGLNLSSVVGGVVGGASASGSLGGSPGGASVAGSLTGSASAVLGGATAGSGSLQVGGGLTGALGVIVP